MSTIQTPGPGVPPSNPQPMYDAPAAPKQRNSLGLVALIIAAVGFIFACIPGALIIGWVLLPIGFILGIVSLFLKGKGKWQGVTAIIVSVVGTVVGVIVFTVVVATAFNDSFGGIDSEVSAPDSSVTEEADTAAEEPAAEVGTRENPAALGSTIEGDEWTVVINSVNLDATDMVLAENEFNGAPDEGTVYIAINYTLTYTGSDPDGEYPAMVGIEYVTADGVTVNSLDKVIVGPDAMDSISVIYEGASVTGNHFLQVPAPVDGVIAVRPGMIADKVFVAIQ